MNHLLGLGEPIEALKIAEVGCGSGTYALALNLLGAQTTLIDADEQALEVARKAFQIYGRKAEFIRTDVLGTVPSGLAGSFHLVASGGLAEHFCGIERKKCVAFHRALLRDGGFARIGVPNRLSPFYQAVRGFRVLTGTWDLDVEIPFSPGELKAIATSVGFERYEVIGNYPLYQDAREYLLGLAYAFSLLFPTLREFLKHRRGNGTAIEEEHGPPMNMASVVSDSVATARLYLGRQYRKGPKDLISAGIILHAFR